MKQIFIFEEVPQFSKKPAWGSYICVHIVVTCIAIIMLMYCMVDGIAVAVVKCVKSWQSELTS